MTTPPTPPTPPVPPEQPLDQPGRQPGLAAGWYQDPQGRFAARYFDGQSWTPTVRDHGNWVGPEWQAPRDAPAYPTAPLPAEHYSQAGGMPPGLGLLVVIAGLVLVALSLFGLDWLSNEFLSLSFSDIRDAMERAGSDSVDNDLQWAYFMYLGWSAAGLVAALALVGAWPATRTYLHRSVPAVAALGAGVLHVYVLATVAEDIDGADLSPGAWLAAAGYALVLVGSLLGPGRPVRRVQPGGPGW